jgi:hypothetical protein
LCSTPDRDDDSDSEYSDLARKNSNAHRGTHHVLEPQTPSKNLFSPSLRSDSVEHHTIHTHGSQKRSDAVEIDHMHSVTTDHYKKYEDLHDHSESPAEEIKQHTLDDSVDMEDEQGEEVEEEDPEVFNPYHFIAHLPDHLSVVLKDKICLPAAKTHLPSLVLDLDETLVHCTVEPVPKPDLIFPVE